MVAGLSRVKGDTARIFSSASQAPVEDHFVAQRDAIELERAIAALGAVEVANDVADAETEPLVELQCVDARCCGGDEQQAGTLGSAMVERGLDQG